MTIYEILEGNVIVNGSEELGILITANGSYIQVWVSVGNEQDEIKRWKAVEATPSNSNGGWFEKDFLSACGKVLEEIISNLDTDE